MHPNLILLAQAKHVLENRCRRLLFFGLIYVDPVDLLLNLSVQRSHLVLALLSLLYIVADSLRIKLILDVEIIFELVLVLCQPGGELSVDLL